MAFLIPAGLLIIGLLCCIGIAVLLVQARTDERKASAQKALVATQKASARSATPTTTVIPATPVPSTPPTSSTDEPANSTGEPANADAKVKNQVSKASSTHTQEITANNVSSTFEKANGHQEHEAQNGNGHVELQNLQIFAEMEQIAQLFQEGKLSKEWVREQIQELSVKMQDMHQQSSLIERHIALLNQIAMYMGELEQVRHEYKVLREKRAAVLRIPTQLHSGSADGDTYIHTDKRPSVRKYTLKTM